MRDSAEFFVGYRPTPWGYSRFLHATVVAAVFSIGALSALLSIAQRDPGPGRWDESEITVGGTLRLAPYPVLYTDRPFLLVGQGKRGFGERMAGLEGRTVRVRGLLIERDDLRLLEVAEGPDAITIAGDGGAQPEGAANAAPVTLRGQLIDPKCFCGAMKPGDGKTHKACAALCLRGGIPPVLAARDSTASVRYYVLADAAGAGLVGGDLARVARFAGDVVEITGVVQENSGLHTLRADLASLRRL